MNKHFLFQSLIILLAASMSLTLASCSSDDDDNSSSGANSGNGNPMAKPGVFGLNSKHLVETGIYSSWGEPNTYSYYNSGALAKIYDDDYGYTYLFSEDQNTIDVTHKLHSYKNHTNKVKFNNLGYVAKILTVTDVDDVDFIGMNDDFIYDKEGHLLKAGNVELIWQNDLLMKIIDKDDHMEYTYEYSEKYPNKYYQYVKPLLSFTNKLPEHLAYIGFLGKGPSYLPVQRTEKKTISGNAYEESYTYGLNDDGTIAYNVKIRYDNSTSYYYAYE